MNSEETYKVYSALLIDDDTRIRMAVEYNLNLDSFEVITADNGQDGIESAKKHKPDLILLDWMMPDMDGIEVLKQLKKKFSTKKIPVFMFTAKSMMSERETATEQVTDPYRVNRPGTQIQGTGLGLHITKEIVRMHGGIIKVQSKLNQGTKFKIYMPLTKTAMTC